MKEKEKIYNNIMKFIFYALLITFLTLYISNKTGYYEYSERKKTILTEEKIRQFEEDVKNGVDVNLEEYLDSTKVNYNNNTSRFGLFLSNKISEYVRGTIEATFKMLDGVITD